jgi:hypothetical protein
MQKPESRRPYSQPSFRLHGNGGIQVASKDKRDSTVRTRGGGQKGALVSLENKLLFILFYFRFYPIQALQGYLFGMGQPQANQWVHRLTEAHPVASGGAALIGRVNWKTLPPCGLSSIQMYPPCASTARRQKANPRPVPRRRPV